MKDYDFSNARSPSLVKIQVFHSVGCGTKSVDNLYL